MADKIEDPKETAEPESPKRGRPTGKASKPKRENYADQLKQLRTRVGFARSLFRFASPSLVVGRGVEPRLLRRLRLLLLSMWLLLLSPAPAAMSQARRNLTFSRK